MNELSGNRVATRLIKLPTKLIEKSSLVFIIELAGIAVVLLLAVGASIKVSAQNYGQPYTTAPVQTNYNDQSTVKQEIARLEIKVVRGGEMLPISQVPRVNKGDVLKVRLLDEPVSGVKIDQTAWDWTLLVAYANPLVNKQKEETVTAEVNFRRQGWYKEYSFVVPFDSQPVFFLTPRAHNRDQILKAMSKNFGDISKIGEKMVEISGAYAQISTFLNELQTVVNRNQYGYNPYGYNNPYGSSPYGSPYGGTYNPYGGTYNNGAYPTTGGQYGYNQPYGSSGQMPTYYQNPYWLDMAVERLMKSFNVAPPSCWYANTGFNNNNGGYYNGYNNGYNNGNNYLYGGTYGSTYPTTGSYGTGSNESFFSKQDFVARSQCVAKSMRLEDFDISVTRMWQQGGVFLAAELQKKYPQLSFYINIAAAAIDFIVKAFQKSPLRIVPTMLVSADANNAAYQSNPSATSNNTYTPSYQNNFAPGTSAQPSATTLALPGAKFSMYSNSPPNDQGYLTAYPIVVQKWQSQADPEVVRLPVPSLDESCIHAGINLLKNTSLTDDWAGDSYTRDFKLVMTSDNGFKKEFPLRKNLGLGGWEMNLTPQDAAQIPKVAMSLEGQIIGMRGFSQVASDKFKLPVATDSHWEIVPESQKDFAVGGKRRVALKNTAGDCLCIQSVTYKPSFGGQFTFERGGDNKSLQTSVDGKTIYFEIDTANFNPGQGTLEVKTFGGESSNLILKLYPAVPAVKDVRIARGDRQVLISGERLDQLRYLVINGYRATIQPNAFPPDERNPQITTKLAIFDDPRIRQTGNAATIELGLEDDRRVSYPENFALLPSRPAIVADDNSEIDGISDAELTVRASLPVKTARATGATVASTKSKNEDDAAAGAGGGSIAAQLIANRAAVFPINTKTVSVSVQNSLSDYDFKNENLKIETRIERSQGAANDFIKPQLEVLDWKTMRIKFYLSGDTYTNLGGRRIQFRIRDSERGDSDWYTIRQTFTRLPEIESVKCTGEMNGMCEMKGEGIDYVGQVSVDGGKTWYSGGAAGSLQAEPTADGKSQVLIPLLINKKLLRLKLRDYSETSGLFAGNFLFASTIKAGSNFARVNSTGADNKKREELSAGSQNQTVAPPANTPAAGASAMPGVQSSNASGTQIVSASPAATPVATDSSSQLPRLPEPSKPAPVYPGSVQMIDEIIDLGKPAKP